MTDHATTTALAAVPTRPGIYLDRTDQPWIVTQRTPVDAEDTGTRFGLLRPQFSGAWPEDVVTDGPFTPMVGLEPDELELIVDALDCCNEIAASAALHDRAAAQKTLADTLRQLL